MKPFKEKFARVETKFIISKEKLQQCWPIFEQYLEPNEYAESTIANLYYDTPNYSLIRASLEKPYYKEKIRVRSYDKQAKQDSQVFVEIKKKHNKVVYKRRLTTNLQASSQLFTQHGHDVIEDSQIKNEIVWLNHKYGGLQPAMYIYYERYALQGKEDASIRITFDHHLLYRNYDLSLEHGVYGESLLSDDDLIMEVKVAGSYPMWLSQLLSEQEIFKSSFSKYGTAYQLVRKQGGIQYA